MTDFYRERQCAESVARRAGHHVVRERARHLDISLKAPHDVVTNVDRSTEELIVEQISNAFPDDAISGEEYGEQERDSDESTDRRWVIDPIDGTLNFAHGVPLYCVSIGFEVAGKTEVGVIYDPNRDELFSAARGRGVHCNGEPLAVSTVDALATSVLVTGFPLGDTQAFEWTMDQFDLLTRGTRGIRRLGSAALDCAYVAAGRLEAFWEYGLKPWDTAAGYLMVTEAGGEVTTIEGGPFSIEDYSIAATNGHIHGELLEVLQSVT